MKVTRQNRYNGQMSAGAKKRLARSLTLLVQSTEKKWIYNEVTKRMMLHKLSFITLTVSDPSELLTASQAFKLLLNPWLQWLRRTIKCNTYIWKAELQENGQIHYHVTTPAFIPWSKIRDKWNNLQKKAGLLDNYYSNKGHYDANSTDVHEVQNINDLSSYMIKYMCKCEKDNPCEKVHQAKKFENSEIATLGAILSNVQASARNAVELDGKTWDCSDNLKKNSYFKVEMSNRHFEDMEKQVETGEATRYDGERFTIYKFCSPVQERVLSRSEVSQYSDFLAAVRKGNVYEYPKETIDTPPPDLLKKKWKRKKLYLPELF